ncbi:hypothetical protein ACTQ4K_19640 [Clostridium sporogenes]|uniref:hypothetical protein n=1 Tax=Clostridium sporogenes TaxID=1509 RepID=UPI003F9246DD
MKKFNTKIISATLASLIALTMSVPAFVATYNKPSSLEGISAIEKMNSNSKGAEDSKNINFNYSYRNWCRGWFFTKLFICYKQRI